MILGVRTDKPEAELYLYDGTRLVAKKLWYAHRTLSRDILTACTELTQQAAMAVGDVTGLVVYKGPGSFTGLRIGCTVANALAASRDVPIVGTSGEGWMLDGVARLQNGDNDRMVLPDYGAPPRITTPKK